MRAPSFADAFEVLCLQAASDGRGPVLFGDSVARARSFARPFLVGTKCPSIYLEFPLLGDPFLDVTLLYGELATGTRIDVPAAAGSEAMIDWFAGACADYEDVCCGFELDTSKPELPAAAVHFQPRVHRQLVEPFCAAIGEPERARLYLDLAERMPSGWPLSFFGMFRGRPGTPLRVCGYLGYGERERCAQDAGHVAEVFDQVGFSAYDDAMLEGIVELMRTASTSLDFQFDVYPDGSLGDVFAIDVKFDVEQPEAVHASLDGGPGAAVLGLFERWGIADERWRLIADGAFARSLPVERDDGTLARYAFTLMPGWAKARWADTVLQPSKFYLLAKAGFVDELS